MKRFLPVAILGLVVTVAAGCEDPMSLSRRQAVQARAAALQAEEARAVAQVQLVEAQAEKAAAQAAKIQAAQAGGVQIAENEENLPADGIRLALDAKGTAQLNGQEIAADAVEAEIKALVADKPLPVVITADAACPYASVLSVIQSCQKAGITQIHLSAAAKE
ncbi:MAG: biopolymer transporter ExbD [Planctomycetia bacterium]|nr:biopolymer transporter ExbD [Planctomycetia bacterium]